MVFRMDIKKLKKTGVLACDCKTSQTSIGDNNVKIYVRRDEFGKRKTVPFGVAPTTHKFGICRKTVLQGQGALNNILLTIQIGRNIIIPTCKTPTIQT